MKKILSLFIVFIILYSNSLSALAITTEIVDDIDVMSESIENKEEKIYCSATLDDDFKSDSVIVVLKNKASLCFNDYVIDDFDLENIEEVNDLTFDTFCERKEEYQKFKENKSTVSLTNVYMGENFSSEENKYGFSNYHQILKINLSNKGKENVLSLIKKLEKREDVLVAHPNYIQKQDSVPNDTYYDNQWGSQRINLHNAWNITTGSKSVTVGIIDSGIKRAHSDLTDNVDTTLSKSFTGDNAPFTDSTGHGTNVAGIIGAIGNNQKGVAGVCWKVKLVSLKTGLDVALAIKALDYAEKNKIPIINYSMSINSDYLALKYAIQNYNGLFICSAGNGNLNVDSANADGYIYPSRYRLPNVISVAATDENNQLAVWGVVNGTRQASNYGSQSVNVAAPGNNLLTTHIGNTSDLYYIYQGGTSLSAPYVTGIAALIKSKYPSISNYGLRSAILDSVDKLSSLSGKVKTGGIVNAYKALNDVQNHKFTVVYNKNGGSGTNMSNTTVIYGIPTNLRENTYTSNTKGYKFAGWYAYRHSDNKWFYQGSSGNGWYVEGAQPNGYKKYLYKDQASIAHTSGTRNDTVTMYAQWIEPIKYNLVFMPNGGGESTQMPQQTITYGVNTKISANIYKKGEYHFIGWTANRKSDNKWYYSNGSDTGWFLEGSQPNGYTKYKYRDQATVAKTTAVDGDKVYLFAQWEINTYNVSFDSNGGNGAMSQITGVSGSPIKLSSNTFLRQNYSFLGWYICDDCGYWSYEDDSWETENTLNKKLYYDTDEVTYCAYIQGDNITAYAQWIKTDDIVLGDANLDGTIDIKDVSLIQLYLSNIVNISEANIAAADVNQNGVVDVNDATLIQLYISGNISGF